MSRKAGSITAAGPGKWVVRITLGTDIDGRRVTRAKTITGTKKDAQAALSRLIIENQSASESMTLDAACTRWLSLRKVGFSTSDRNRHLIENIRRGCPLLLARRVDTIRPSDIDSALIQIGEKGGKNHAPLSPRSVHHCRGTMRQVFRMLEKDGVISSNPVTLSAPVSIPQKPTVTVDPQGISALLRATEGSWLHIAVLIMVATGLRRGELLGLKWSDLTDDGLSVTRSLKRTESGWKEGEVKTKTSMRVVSIGDNVRSAIESHIQAQKDSFLARIKRVPRDWWIIEGPEGGQASAEWLTKSLTARMKALGLKGSAHTLRHAHASIALDAGAAIPAVSARLGHSSPAITSQIYAHRTTEADQRLADSVDAFFAQSPHNSEQDDGV
jgi:integrase